MLAYVAAARIWTLLVSMFSFQGNEVDVEMRAVGGASATANQRPPPLRHGFHTKVRKDFDRCFGSRGGEIQDLSLGLLQEGGRGPGPRPGLCGGPSFLWDRSSVSGSRRLR